MLKYEVYGIGYDEDRFLTDYLKPYGQFDTPAEALLFAHNIDKEWLKEHGELTDNIATVEVSVEMCNSDGTFTNEEPLWHDCISIYHKINSGLQQKKVAV